MIWKGCVVLSLAMCVLCDRRPFTEVHVKKHYKELSHDDHQKFENQEEYAYAHPSYEFSYKVDDPHTHDKKEQQETRDGDQVTGHYWLIQPDGHKRLVKYHVDGKRGFSADINYALNKYEVHYNTIKHDNHEDKEEKHNVEYIDEQPYEEHHDKEHEVKQVHEKNEEPEHIEHVEEHKEHVKDYKEHVKEYKEHDYEPKEHVKDYKEHIEEPIENVEKHKKYDVGHKKHNEEHKEHNEGHEEHNEEYKEHNEENKEHNEGHKEHNEGHKENNEGHKKHNEGHKEHNEGHRDYNEGHNEYNEGLKEYNEEHKKNNEGHKEHNEGHKKQDDIHIDFGEKIHEPELKYEVHEKLDDFLDEPEKKTDEGHHEKHNPKPKERQDSWSRIRNWDELHNEHHDDDWSWPKLIHWDIKYDKDEHKNRDFSNLHEENDKKHGNSWSWRKYYNVWEVQHYDKEHKHDGQHQDVKEHKEKHTEPKEKVFDPASEDTNNKRESNFGLRDHEHRGQPSYHMPIMNRKPIPYRRRRLYKSSA